VAIASTRGAMLLLLTQIATLTQIMQVQVVIFYYESSKIEYQGK
jgi:hypothetical protein